MTAPLHLRGWDLHIRSDIPLPGGMPLSPDDGAVEVDITVGAAVLVDPDRSDGPYRLGRNGIEFTMPGVACYLCTADRVVVDPVRGASIDEIAAMLVATAIPALLWARGDLVLHAAAAILPGTTRAIALLGRSGSGKSHLLSHALAAGAEIVADDSIRVRGAADGVWISGLPGGYFAASGACVDDRPFHPVEPIRQRARAELGALIVLDGSVTPGRLAGVPAVRALLAQRHRPRAARLLGVEAATLPLVTRIAREMAIIGCDSSHRDAMAALLAIPRDGIGH